MARVGINGFGRIGKLFLRNAIERYPTKIIPSVINDPALNHPKQAVYNLKNDSIHGHFKCDVCCDDKTITVNGHKIDIFHEKDAKKVPWSQSTQYIVECSGGSHSMAKSQQLVEGQVKKLIISAPAPDAHTIVLGVNDCEYNEKMKVISMASCTTNCVAPIAKLVHERFGIREGFMNTIHAVTPFQKVVDSYSDLSPRVSRSGWLNIIPYRTGAATALTQVIPSLKGKVTGLSFRVPVPICSVIDFTIKLCQPTSLKDINERIKDASKCSMTGIIQYEESELVSTDIRGNTHSAIYDSTASMQLGEHFFKLIMWYDNEIGYVCRMGDFIAMIYKQECDAVEAEREKKEQEVFRKHQEEFKKNQEGCDKSKT